MNRRKLVSLLSLSAAWFVTPKLKSQPITPARLTEAEFWPKYQEKIQSLGDVPKGIEAFIRQKAEFWFQRYATMQEDEVWAMLDKITLESAVKEEEEDYQKDLRLKEDQRKAFAALSQEDKDRFWESFLKLPAGQPRWSRRFHVKGQGWVTEEGIGMPPWENEDGKNGRIRWQNFGK